MEQFSFSNPSALINFSFLTGDQSPVFSQFVCDDIKKRLEFDLGVSKAFRKVIEFVLPASLAITLMRN